MLGRQAARHCRLRSRGAFRSSCNGVRTGVKGAVLAKEILSRDVGSAAGWLADVRVNLIPTPPTPLFPGLAGTFLAYVSRSNSALL